jgi:hypothetical protein
VGKIPRGAWPLASTVRGRVIWGDRVHTAQDAATGREGRMVRSWAPPSTMDPLEDLLVGLPEEVSVVQRIRCSIEDGAALPVPECEQDVMWEELHLLVTECCSRKRARFKRIQAFQGLWFR